MKEDKGQVVAAPESLFSQAERAAEQGMFVDATTLLFQAAKLGHTGAQVNLGNNFSSGIGVPRSDAKAAYWYRMAYRSGDESGALNLAIDRLKQNRTRSAMFWLKRAVAMGSGEATLELAKVYLTSLKRNKTKAIHLLEKTRAMRQSEISEQAQEDAAKLLLAIKSDGQ